MDVEDLILISGFSKLTICKSRLNAFNVVEGRKSVKMHGKPRFSRFRAKALQAPFAESLFAGINAECLLRALICRCAGKQASWKGATRCLLYMRQGGKADGQNREGTHGGLGLPGGQLQGCGGTIYCLGKVPSTKERHWLPHHLPQLSTPHTHTSPLQ